MQCDLSWNNARKDLESDFERSYKGEPSKFFSLNRSTLLMLIKKKLPSGKVLEKQQHGHYLTKFHIF